MHGGHQSTLDVPVILHARNCTHAEEVYTGPYLLLRERVGRQALYGRCFDVPGRLFRIRTFGARSSLDYHRDFLPLYVPWREWSPQRGLEISRMVTYNLYHSRISYLTIHRDSGLRHAQALGMHRDPGWQKWDNMHCLERELRLSGWWWLVISDR